MSTTTTKNTRLLRPAMLGLMVALAFVASYQFALAANGEETNPAASVQPLGETGVTASTSAGCACCGDTGSGETIEGAAAVEGDVQKITVDASSGYNPNVIKLSAGVPAEITFTNASSCLGQVISEDLGFSVDFNDGPKTVRIEADTLQPGEYGFSCSMQMVFGTIVVE